MHKFINIVFIIIIIIICISHCNAQEKDILNGIEKVTNEWTINSNEYISIKNNNNNILFESKYIYDYKYATITQKIDLTNVQKLTFNINILECHINREGYINVKIDIDDKNIAQILDNKQYNMNLSYNIDNNFRNGSHNVKFIIGAENADFKLKLSNISLLAIPEPPKITKIYLNDENKAYLAKEDSIRINYELIDTILDPPYNINVNWGDGIEKIMISNGNKGCVEHKYDKGGTYTVSISGLLLNNNTKKYEQGEKLTTTVNVIDYAYITVNNNRGSGLSHTATFVPHIKNADYLKWDFGDNTEIIESENRPTDHTYYDRGIFNVSFTATLKNGKYITVNKENAVKFTDEYIRFSKEIYNKGEVAELSWKFADVLFDNHIFYIQIYEINYLGEYTGKIIYNKRINEEKGSVKINTDNLDNDRYIALISINGERSTLKTVLEIKNNEQQIDKDKTKKTELRKMSTSYFTTIRVLDSLTGVPIHNASVRAVGKSATNPIDWISNLFGENWGKDVLNTEVNGTTDNNGVITFFMFPNIKYEITTSYKSITKKTSIQPSAMNAEYLIKLEVTAKPNNDASIAVKTKTITNGNNITVKYEDLSNTTKYVNYLIKEGDTNGKTIINKTYNKSQTNKNKFYHKESFKIDNPTGKSYNITITANTEKYGEIKRNYGTRFPGPLIDIGIPSGLYIYLCLGILLMFAAAGTIITGSIIGICICFIGWILYFMGWMFALETAPTALSLATVLSILFYIRTRSES